MTLRRLSLAVGLLILSPFVSTGAAPAEIPRSEASDSTVQAQLEASGLERLEEEELPPARWVPTGTIVEAELVAIDDQAAGGSTIDRLSPAFTNSHGTAGFTGGLANDDDFVWFDDGITWLNSDHMPEVLTGGESTMGISDAGGFIYSPAVDGADSVWTDTGLLLSENTQAPGFPAGTNSTFHSRPTMSPGGRAYWVAGFNESGGTATEGRMLYTSSDATAGNTLVLLRSDDVIDTFTIARTSGVGFDYDFSDDGSHHIHELKMDTGSQNDDDFIYVDGSLVAREGDPTGGGDNWESFDVVSINNAGDYVFSGGTDGPSATNEFIAVNGAIALREGDTIDGVTLSSASVRTLSIAENGTVAHLWDTAGVGEVLFRACSATSFATSVGLLRIGDGLDLDGNGTSDGTVTDFNSSAAIGPGIDLAADGTVLVEIDLDQGAGDLEAIVRLPMGCAIFEDGFESGDTSNWSVVVGG